AVRRGPPGRLSAGGRVAAHGGGVGGGIPGREEGGSAVGLRGEARLQAGADRRPGRVRAGHLEGEGSGEAGGDRGARGGNCHLYTIATHWPVSLRGGHRMYFWNDVQVRVRGGDWKA